MEAMQATSMIFRVLLLLTCAANIGCSVTIELYSGQNYSDFLKKVTVNQNDETECIQLGQFYEVRSLKTEKCVIVYETGKCNRIDKQAHGSTMYSVRVERDTALLDIDPAYSNRKEERGVQSFHVCATEPLLNVDIYSGTYYTGDLVASYRRVCECKNIPSYMSKGLKSEPFSIDNHGRNMYFYDKEDCTGQPTLIPAGDNERSRSVLRHDDARAVVIRSFRPADDLPCPKLDASIYKFMFSDGLHSNLVKQDITYTMTNRQHTAVTEYINSMDLDTAEYSVAKPFTYIHTTRVKAGVAMSLGTGLSSFLKSTLQSSLETHYQYPNTNQNTPTIVTKPIGGKPSPIQVDVPPCTTCTVNVSVDKYQGYPISYTAEAIVTGMAGDDKLSAEQIRHFLPPGMEYVKNNDDYSVVVRVEGEMKASRDWYYKEISCIPLPDCWPYLSSSVLSGK